MAKPKKAVQALEGAAAISEAQTIVKRLIEDEELRDAVGTAIESSRRVYDRVSSAKKPSKLIEDKKLQADALQAYTAIRTVAVGLTGAGKSLPVPNKKSAKQKKGGFGRVLLLAGGGAGVALVASEGLRSKLLDALFGAEEEFEYSPPAPPATTDTPGNPLSAV